MKGAFRAERIPLILPTMLLFMVLFAVGFYYLKGKHDWATDRLQDVDQRHARLAGLESSRAELDKAESTARSSLAVGVYPASQDVSQAGNDAQRRVRDTFTKAGLQVMSSQVLAAKIDRAFDRIPMAVRLEGELVALQGALTVIPELSPAVIIDGVTVQTIGAVKADAPQRLAIQFSLSVLRARP